MEPNEVDKLFSDLPSQDKVEADIFNEKPKETEAKPEKEEEEAEGKKNRRHRRLEERLQQEREANITLTERVKALSEAQEFTRDFIKSNKDDVDPDLVRIFGESPEGKEIARIMEQKMNSVQTRAEERALEKFYESQRKEEVEVKQYESQIDAEIESIEDEYGVDLSSNSPTAKKARRDYLDLVVKLSPKDEDGNITNYADFSSAFEVYQSTKERPDASRNKELASRSVQKSGQTDTSELNDQATREYLKSIGIRL